MGIVAEQFRKVSLKRLCRWIIALILTVIVAFFFFGHFWRTYALPEKPEYLKSLAFLHQNRDIEREFGQISSVSLVEPFRYFTTSDGKEGLFSFELSGSKDSGTVAVHWTYDPEVDKYSVTKLLRTAPLERSGILRHR